MMEEGEAMMEEGEAMMEEGEAMMEEGGHDGAMMEEEEGAMMEEEGAMMEKTSFSGTVIAGTSAPLLEYSKADYDKAIASDKLVVLYFYANWCPICKKEFKDTEAAFNELQSDNVVGFRIHYNDTDTTDEQKQLAKEFGVGYQHTKVFIKDGQRVLKSPESWSKSRYASEIGKFVN